jgi:hypothetical protein
MARSDSAADAANSGRLKQIALTYKMTRKADKKIGLVLAGVFILILGVFLAIGFLIGHPVYLGILGFLLAFLGTAVIFGRRAERAAFGQMEGQPGAAAAVLDNIGRGWTTTPAVAMNRIVADVPVHDIVVGTGEGRVELKKVRTTMLKLPRVLTGPQVTATNDRLRAMGDLMSNMPVPKGPMPKGMKLPKGGGRSR